MRIFHTLALACVTLGLHGCYTDCPCECSGGDCDEDCDDTPDTTPDSEPPDSEPPDTAPPDSDLPPDSEPPDSGDSDPVDLDADGDGYEVPEDCDDEDPAIHPHALDIKDGIDNDCDGEVDVSLLAYASGKFIGEASGDWAGASVAGLGDVDGDGFDDIAVGSWYESSVGEEAGAVYVLNGPVSGTFSLAYSDAKMTGEVAGDTLSRPAEAGDMDHDGIGDIILCAQWDDTAANGAGAAYLVKGPVAGAYSVAEAHAKLLGEEARDGVMRSVRAYDVNGDGEEDYLIGAPGDDSIADGSGAAYLVTGPVSGVSSLRDAEAKLLGSVANDMAGAFLAGPGDLDGDGYADMVIGDHNGSLGGDQTGTVYVVYGPYSGEARAVDAASAVFLGDGDQGHAGKVAVAGDFDGKGTPAFLTTAMGDEAGGVYIFVGAQYGDLERSDCRAICNLGAADAVGVGDVNGDGVGDVLAGHYEGAYVVFGGTRGQVDPGDANLEFWAEEPDDYAGWRVAAAGDTNADGYADLLIGAKAEDTAGETAGAAYLVLGGPD